MVYTTNLVLHGRKIRLERGKAERESFSPCSVVHYMLTMASGSVILSKKDGTAVTEAEARHLLERYGRIELCVPANSRTNNLDGMFIKFAFYLDCQDALKVKNPRRWCLRISTNRVKPGSSQLRQPVHSRHRSCNGAAYACWTKRSPNGSRLYRASFHRRYQVDLCRQSPRDCHPSRAQRHVQRVRENHPGQRDPQDVQ